MWPTTTQSAGSVEYTNCSFAEGLDSPNECPRYDTNQSDDEAPIMLNLWEVQSAPSLPSLPGPLWLAVVVPERVLFMGQIELFDIKTIFKQMTYAKLNCLKYNYLIIQLYVNKWLKFFWIVSDI